MIAVSHPVTTAATRAVAAPTRQPARRLDHTRPTDAGPATRDRGAIDVSVEMLFGTVTVLMAVLLVFETAAFWHARNVLDDAAADGARTAAAFDGTCADGVGVARAAVERHAGSWADDVVISCSDGPLVVVTVTGTTPGVVGDALGMRASASESAPRER